MEAPWVHQLWTCLVKAVSQRRFLPPFGERRLPPWWPVPSAGVLLTRIFHLGCFCHRVMAFHACETLMGLLARSECPKGWFWGWSAVLGVCHSMSLLCVLLPLQDHSLPFNSIPHYLQKYLWNLFDNYPIFLISYVLKLITLTSEMALVHASLIRLNWNPLAHF